MATIRLNNEVVTVLVAQYRNRRLALTCVDADGFPYATLTVNLENEEVGENEAFIDTNNVPDAVAALRNAELIGEEPIKFAKSGYCRYPLYTIHVSKIKSRQTPAYPEV